MLKSPRFFFLFILSFSLTSLFAQHGSNYILIIDKDTLAINLDEKQEVKLSEGNTLSIELTQPNELTYTDKMVTFKYPKNFSISNTDIGGGIEQCALINANGSGFMVQKYSTINPTLFNELMLNELTKESISYGYTMDKKPFERKLPGGQVLKGTTAILTYHGEEEIYSISSYGEKDRGIMVVTMILAEEFKEVDENMIELFLNTLKILE